VQQWFDGAELATLLTALDRPRLFPRTSSMGRLFDAVAALCGLPATVSFEGQAAMGLEAIADVAEESCYPLPLGGDGATADWQPLIEGVVRDLGGGTTPATVSARFHNALSRLAVQIARRAGCRQIALTGGCFQNRLLADRVCRSLSESGFDVYTQQQVPPGDGGLALGQLLGAAYQVGG
jgi:hydrogenase maturation protein HypF